MTKLSARSLQAAAKDLASGRVTSVQVLIAAPRRAD
jgi:hypothetical protein